MTRQEKIARIERLETLIFEQKMADHLTFEDYQYLDRWGKEKAELEKEIREEVL